MLGGFGLVGAAAGALVAVGVPLVGWMLGAGEESGTLADRQERLSDSLGRVSDMTKIASGGIAALKERYGEATEAVRELVRVRGQAAIDEARAAADALAAGSFSEWLDTTAIEDFEARTLGVRDAIEGMTLGAAELALAFDLTGQEAVDLQAAMQAASDAATPEEQVAAFETVRNLLVDLRAKYGDLPPAARELLGALANTEDMLRQALARVEEFGDATDEAATKARALAGAWGTVAANSKVAAQWASAAASAGRGRGSAVAPSAGGAFSTAEMERPGSFAGGWSKGTPVYTPRRAEDFPTYAPAPVAASSKGGGGGGRGGGKSDAERAAEEEARIVKRIKDQAWDAYYRDLDRLREEDLRKTEAANETLGRSFGDMFADLTTGAASLGDTFRSLGAEIGRNLLVSGFTNLFAASGAGATGWGRAIDSLFGGGRAAGGPVAAGAGYLVGERGPELVVPRTAGQVIPNSALRRGEASAARPTNINVNVSGARGNSEIMEMVRAGVGQGLRQYDAGLADRVNQISHDPRFRG